MSEDSSWVAFWNGKWTVAGQKFLVYNMSVVERGMSGDIGQESISKTGIIVLREHNRFQKRFLHKHSFF